MKCNIKRLLRLAEILDDVPRKLYTQKTFGDGGNPHTCGTPACALGWWAATHKRRWALSSYQSPILKGVIGTWESAALEFGLNYDPSSYGEVRELFSASGCGNARTAKQAARYIRKFVARKRAEETA